MIGSVLVGARIYIGEVERDIFSETKGHDEAHEDLEDELTGTTI